jgi:hypothetical protein
MRNKINEPERLDTFIHSFSSYNSDSKATVVRLVDQLDSVSQAAVAEINDGANIKLA